MLKGVMVNKDVTHPRMRRMIKNPRIILLDCSLEYKKGESQVLKTHVHRVMHTNALPAHTCSIKITVVGTSQ